MPSVVVIVKFVISLTTSPLEGIVKLTAFQTTPSPSTVYNFLIAPGSEQDHKSIFPLSPLFFDPDVKVF